MWDRRCCDHGRVGAADGSDGPTFCAHMKCRTVAAVDSTDLSIVTAATVLHFLYAQNVGPSLPSAADTRALDTCAQIDSAGTRFAKCRTVGPTLPAFIQNVGPLEQNVFYHLDGPTFLIGPTVLHYSERPKKCRAVAGIICPRV